MAILQTGSPQGETRGVAGIILNRLRGNPNETYRSIRDWFYSRYVGVSPVELTSWITYWKKTFRVADQIRDAGNKGSLKKFDVPTRRTNPKGYRLTIAFQFMERGQPDKQHRNISFDIYGYSRIENILPIIREAIRNKYALAGNNYKINKKEMEKMLNTISVTQAEAI